MASAPQKTGLRTGSECWGLFHLRGVTRNAYTVYRSQAHGNPLAVSPKTMSIAKE